MRSLIFVFLLNLTSIYAEECEVPSLEHGEVSGTGDSMSWTGKFTCQPGYSLVGSKTVKCRRGQWSSSIPVCTALVGCDPRDLPAIQHGREEAYSPRQYRGAVYKYKCNRGYRRWGEGLVHCAGQNWDTSRLPICYRTGCPRSGESEMLGGDMRRKGGGGLEFYHCTRPGSVLSGSPTLVCTEHGWNDTAPVCSYGPGLVSLSGPESVTAGETVTYSCSGQDSNPPSTISWNVLTHSGNSAMDLVKISELSSTRTEEGWTTSSSLEISVPKSDNIVGLHLYCSVSNPEVQQETVKEQAVAVHFGPSDLSISGPSAATADDKISLGCVTSPSVPPAQVSWIVSQSASEILSEETIHQAKDGSFSTRSSMRLTVPRGRKVEDIVVQCVASHPSLDQASLEAVHVIRIDNPTTERTTGTTTQIWIPDDITDMKEDLDYYEDESYYEAEYESDEDLYEDTTMKVTESAVQYHKYNEKEEDSVNHVLLEDMEQSEGHSDATVSEDLRRNRAGAEEDSDGISQELGVTDESNIRRSKILQDRDPEEMTFSKSEPTDKSAYSSLKHDTVSMTEAPQKEVSKYENKTVPLKAPRVMNSSSNVRYSIVFLILSIFLSQI